MFGITNINFKNVSENLVYIITTNLLTAFVVYNVSTKTNLKAIEAFTPTIEKAIDKETIVNDIVNEIEVQIDKMKKSDSIQININQEPINNQKPKNQIIKNTKQDSVKKGFWGRLFSKGKYKKE